MNTEHPVFALRMLLTVLLYGLLIFIVRGVIDWRSVLAEGLGGKPLPTLVAAVLQFGTFATIALLLSGFVCLALVWFGSEKLSMTAVSLISAAWVGIISVLLWQVRDAVELILVSFGLRWN